MSVGHILLASLLLLLLERAEVEDEPNPRGAFASAGTGSLTRHARALSTRLQKLDTLSRSVTVHEMNRVQTFFSVHTSVRTKEHAQDFHITNIHNT